MTSYTEVNDLTFTFFDNKGNEANPNKLKNWDLNITLEGSENRVVKRVKNMTGPVTVPLSFDKIFSDLEGEKNSDVVLLITSSFKYNGCVSYLQEGSIRLKRVRLNTVSSIGMQLIRAGKTTGRKKTNKGAISQEEDTGHDDGDGKYQPHPALPRHALQVSHPTLDEDRSSSMFNRLLALLICFTSYLCIYLVSLHVFLSISYSLSCSRSLTITHSIYLPPPPPVSLCVTIVDVVVTVDENLFSIQIFLQTDDGVPFSPPIEDVTITAARAMEKAVRACDN